MTALALMAVLFGFLDSDPSLAKSENLTVYKAATLKAGKDSEAHVRLALWCEAKGMTAERAAEIAEAIRLAPNHAEAHGLNGFVRFEGHWLRPEDVAALRSKSTVAAKLAEYDATRATTGDSLAEQMKLAAWCSTQGMANEAHAHLAAVVRLDPDQAEAWRKLGYRAHEGRWIHPVHEAREKKLSLEARASHRLWVNKFTRLVHELGTPQLRAKAEAELASVHDPLAAPAVWSVFASGAGRTHNLAVKLFRQIDGPDSSSRLTLLAIFDAEGPVRDAATEALASRDPREYIGPVIGYLRKPLKVETTPIGGPGAPGEIRVDDQPFRVYAVPTRDEFRGETAPTPVPPAIDPYAFAAAPRTFMQPGHTYTVTSYPSDPAVLQAFQQAAANPGEAVEIFQGLGALADKAHSAPPVITQVYLPATSHSSFKPHISRPSASALRAAERRSAKEFEKHYQDYLKAVEAQFKADIGSLNDYNARLEVATTNAHELLSKRTGLSIPQEQSIWGKWWTGWNASEGMNSIAARRDLGKNDPPASDTLSRNRLGAGTLVWTDRGQRPVEGLRVGDRVLSQNIRTGVLDYESVVAVAEGVTVPMVTLVLESGDQLTVTPMERIWNSGQGWLAASTLKPGDFLRLVNGPVRMASRTAAVPALGYHVVLIEGNSLFAGKSGLLMHDNAIVQPPSKAFDFPPEIESNRAVTPPG